MHPKLFGKHNYTAFSWQEGATKSTLGATLYSSVTILIMSAFRDWASKKTMLLSPPSVLLSGSESDAPTPIANTSKDGSTLSRAIDLRGSSPSSPTTECILSQQEDHQVPASTTVRKRTHGCNHRRSIRPRRLFVPSAQKIRDVALTSRKLLRSLRDLRHKLCLPSSPSTEDHTSDITEVSMLSQARDYHMYLLRALDNLMYEYSLATQGWAKQDKSSTTMATTKSTVSSLLTLSGGTDTAAKTSS